MIEFFIYFAISITGVLFHFIGNTYIVIFAGILCALDEIIACIRGKAKAPVTIFISILLALGALFAKVNFFYAFCLFECILFIIFSIVGLFTTFKVGKDISKPQTVDDFIDENTKKLEEKSHLPHDICEEAICILLIFDKGAIQEARAFIETSYAVKVMELSNFEIGVAFGLLINENFTQQEAQDYTEKIIKQKLERDKKD